MGKKVANMAGWQIWPWDTLKYIKNIILIIKKYYTFKKN